VLSGRHGLGVAAQGTVIAYARLGVVYRVSGTHRVPIARRVTHVWAVNARRIMVQRDDGRLAILNPVGETLSVLAAPMGSSSTVAGAAMQGDGAVVVSLAQPADGTPTASLDVYRLASGQRTASWPIAGNASGDVTLFGHIAAVGQAGARPTLVIDTTNGHLAHAPIASPIGHIRLQPDGLIYAGGDGHNGLLVRLLPTAQLRAALARA
jgi:hypothetical protein